MTTKYNIPVPVVWDFPDGSCLEELFIDDKTHNQLVKIMKEFREWNELRKYHLWPSRLLLFYGPTGCGQLTTAKMFASDIGVSAVTINCADLIAESPEKTRNYLNDTFEAIRHDIHVVLFDQFHIIGCRSIVWNIFYQQVKKFTGKSIIICVSDQAHQIESPMWKNFDDVFYFGLPSLEEQLKIIDQCLINFCGPKTWFEEYLKDKGFSYDDVVAICDEIIKGCVTNGRRTYTAEDIRNAIEKQERKNNPFRRDLR